MLEHGSSYKAPLPRNLKKSIMPIKRLCMLQTFSISTERILMGYMYRCSVITLKFNPAKTYVQHIQFNNPNLVLQPCILEKVIVDDVGHHGKYTDCFK